ncbi:TetR/AcrR family transcriptional regulator [Arvimicrobium flavum]|uniref:TetR/AcrR family transcriptional regulator n=1 Tax=Arvimicrobium flavum TaxID=3393320 RepID=UPI00237A5E69|nr:TetR/AcrR family transcriptional regulator [Mesorhizobium shangrilense]
MTQKTPRRRRLRKEVRQAELLDAAAQIFREKGYDEASTAEIAERAGVVEGTIYRYFASKRDLLVKVVEQAYEEVIADFEVQLHGISGTWNRLRYMIWRHLKTIEDDPALAKLVTYEIKVDPDYRTMRVFQLNRAYTRRTVEIIEQAIRSGEFVADVPIPIIRDMIYGCIDHHTWSYVRGEGTFDLNTTADYITHLIYRGLAAHSSPEEGSVLARIEERLARIEARFGTTA